MYKAIPKTGEQDRGWGGTPFIETAFAAIGIVIGAALTGYWQVVAYFGTFWVLGAVVWLLFRRPQRQQISPEQAQERLARGLAEEMKKIQASRRPRRKRDV